MSYTGGYCKASLTTPTQLAASSFAETALYRTDVVMLDKPIAVAWAQSDLGLFTPVSAPMLSTASKIPPNTGGKANLATATSSNTSGLGTSDGLSTGAKAGIGVGPAFAFFAAVAAILLLLMYRRQRRSRSTQQNTSDDKIEQLPQPAESSHLDNIPIVEMLSRSKAPVVEAHSDPKTVEADSGAVAELESGWQGHEIPDDTIQRTAR